MFDGIFKPLAILLGGFLDIIFNGLSSMGISKIGVAIVVITFLIKLAMLPLTFSQQKTAKINQLMQPEIKAVRGKYKGRNDTISMQRQQEEIKAVYEKYGISQTGGCIQLVIQIPILFALFQVFRNIPLYVSKLKTPLLGVFGAIQGDSNFLSIMNDKFGGVNWEVQDNAVNALNAFSADQWNTLKELFPANADLISDASRTVMNMNHIFGVNITVAPSQVWGIAILIPICAGIAQFISAKLGQSTTAADQGSKITQTIMLFMMPVISVVIAFRSPAGLGIYWTATAVFQAIFQIFINRHYKKLTTDEVIQKALEKKRKKMEKRGASQESVIRGASLKTRNLDYDSSGSDNSIRAKATFATSSKVKAKNVKTDDNVSQEKPPDTRPKGGGGQSTKAQTESKPPDSGGKKLFGKKKKQDGRSLRDIAGSVNNVSSDNKGKAKKKRK